ncbi:MAG: hypothetical protein V1776_04065 [Candidatus Diapherotrites archaeon]
MIEIFTQGRVCYKTHGRDAGQKVIVLEKTKKGMVVIEGPQTKKSKANIQHLLPTSQIISLPENYTRKQLSEALKG